MKAIRHLQALVPLAALSLSSFPFGVLAQSSSRPANASPAPIQAPAGSVELKVRRLPDSVDLVIEGVGSAPQLQQSASGYVWQGLLLTSQVNGLRRGPQRMALPDAGFESFSLEGSGRVYRLSVTPVPGASVPKPVVSADGRNLILSFPVASRAQSQTMTPSLTMPGRVDQPGFVPPLRSRAEAPPVGDIAVGTMMLANPSYLNVSGPPVTVAWNGPTAAFLRWLSARGGYSFVFVENNSSASAAMGSGGAGPSTTPTVSAGNRPISLTFNNESYGKAFNSALLASGLQGKRDGNMIIAGPNVLGVSFGASMSKVFRLNQVKAEAAADYLANLGATITKTNTIATSVTEGSSQTTAIAGGPQAATTTSSRQTTVETYAAAQGPLKGLLGTTDARLGTMTLVGDPKMIAIAEGYLRQLDLRQRQVALSVKILDVTLDNDSAIENSFAFRYGNNFIVNDKGTLVGAFNNLLPPGSTFNDRLPVGTPQIGVANPGLAYGVDNFYDYVKASIIAGSTKVLASPTLILTDNPEIVRSGSDQTILAQTLSSGSSSGSGSGGGTAVATIGRTKANEAYVAVGEQVIVKYDVTSGNGNSPNTCTPVLGVAGLTFGARVSKIDDNGFVTFSISPAITATLRQQKIENCGPIDILSLRTLDSGSARVRDGQTLIMTGVISDRDTELVTKWPILGDIPLVGQFFRSSNGLRRKRELVIMVTPKIIRDEEGGAYGYGYQPGTSQARDFLRMSSNP